MTKIKKVHCLFEQSGAFKRAFIKRGDRTYGRTKKIPSRIYKVNNKNGIHKSTMTIEYAENFIQDFIFGEKYEKDSEYELF